MTANHPLQTVIPLVSVVVDGYNEARLLGTVNDTLDALQRQDFPLDQVEVVLVGTATQVAAWRTRFSATMPFGSVQMVEAPDQPHYLELKHIGAQSASGKIIALSDADVYPRPAWLSSIVRGMKDGSDVVVGLSLFKSEKTWHSHAPSRLAAASISWGWIVGKRQPDGHYPAVGFMHHNVAFRTDVLRSQPYRNDLGRVCGSPLAFRALTREGARITLQPDQQVGHYFSWTFWLINLHFRFGHEIYVLRREDTNYPNRWIAHTWIFEPVLTMIWHILLDIPRWFRFTDLLGVSQPRRVLFFPVVLLMSVAAHLSEMAGMYATLLTPHAMKRWAETA